MPDPGRFRPRDNLFYLCAFTIASALVLGGGTRGGFLSDAILQLFSLPLLLASLWRLVGLAPRAVGRLPLIFCAAVVLVPLLQLIPLPPAMWTQLPNREVEVETFALLGRSAPWMPLSLAPSLTWLSALSLTPPLAIFLGTVLLNRTDRSMLTLVVLGIGLASVFLGLNQAFQGPTSPLRIFSNTSDAVGFFANRNHFAALLYSLTLFAAAWAVNAGMAAGSAPLGKKHQSPMVVAVLASFTCMVVLIVAQAMTRSRAGIGLTILALLGAFALSLADRRSPSGISPGKILVGSISLAVMFTTQFAMYRIMERFTTDPLQDARITFARRTIEAAGTFMPLGSGMGTFVPVYAQIESPEDVMANVYANRAHNDLLELWLEAGAPGIALIAVFLGWLVLRSITVWRSWPHSVAEVDASLARAASVVVVLLIVHSLLDYPLRTGAMMAIFALACALLVDPPHAPDTPLEVDAEAKLMRHGLGRPSTPPEVAKPPITSVQNNADSPPAGRQDVERWGRDIEWPMAWRKPKGPRDDDHRA